MVVDASAAPVLEATGIHFAYRNSPVLSGIDLDLRPGEMLGIIGPNGSGKSTLLGILSGMLSPAQGRVNLLGQDITEYNRAHLSRLLGLVPQSAELAFGFTVMETVLSGRYSIMGKRFFESADDHRAAQRALADTGLTRFADRRAGELSGGERQRLMLARALAAEPKIQLLDEPTSALDMRHQLMIMGLLEKLSAEQQTAVCLVSHDLNLASLYCDRLLLLCQGRAMAMGRPEDVLTPGLLQETYQVRVVVDREPGRGRPRVTPAVL